MESVSIPQLPLSSDDAYLQQHGVFEIVNRMTSDIAEQKPVDYIAFMLRWLENAMTGAKEGSSNEPPLDCDVFGTSRKQPSSEDCSFSGNAISDNENTQLLQLAVFAPVREPELGILGTKKEVLSGGDDSGVTRDGEHVLQDNEAQKSDSSMENCKNFDKSSIRTPETGGGSHGSLKQDALLPSTKQLMNVVQLLPPSEHTAALVFLEGLLDKKCNSIKSTRVPLGAEVSQATTVQQEGDGRITESIIPSPVSPSSYEAANRKKGSRFASAHLQDVVNDALTASIFLRELSNGEEGIGESSQQDCNKTPSPSFCHVHSFAGTNFTTKDSSLSRELCLPTPCRDSLLEESPLPLALKKLSGTYSGLGSSEISLSKRCSIVPEEECKAMLKNMNTHEDELDAARKGIAVHDLFYGCNETQMECVIRSMVRRVLSADELFLYEDALMFVCSGTLALERGDSLLRQLSPGECFGWLDKMRDSELHSPIYFRALSDAVVLSIQSENFRVIEDNEKEMRRSMFLMFIRESPLLSILPSGECRRLACSFRVRNFDTGSVIMQRGEPVEWVSLIMSGTVRRIIHDEKKYVDASEGCNGESDNSHSINCETSIDLMKGSVIGDLELLFCSKLILDAVAVTNVTVARIHMVYFQSIVSRQIMEDMKCVVAKNPDNALLASQFPPELLQEIGQVAKRDNVHPKRKSSLSVTQRTSSTSQALTIPNSRRWTVVGTEGKSCLRARRRCVRSSGEIVYAGKQNHYRFPLCAIESSNTVMIAVVLDGTIIRWNNVADRVTGFSQHYVLGQCIFSFLVTEAARENMRNQLQQAAKFAGKWDGYVSAGLSSPRAYRFRQASALYHVHLFLSVVPSCVESSGEVMLLVGRKEESHAGGNYMEDAVQWMKNVLRPQLRAFQKRVEILEAKKWEISPEDGKRLHGHMEACNRLMKYYLQLSSLNMESMNELWKPIRLCHMIQKFTWEVLPLIHAAGNRFTTTIDEVFSREEVFLHVEHVLEVLRRVVCSANDAGSNICISMEVEATPAAASSRLLSPSAPPTVSKKGSLAVDTERFSNIAIPLFTTQPSAQSTESTKGNDVTTAGSSIALGLEDVWICATKPHRRVIDESASFSMRHIRIIVSDSGTWINSTYEAHSGGEKKKKAMGMLNSPEYARNDADEKLSKRRVMILKECAGLVSTMGGNLMYETTPCAELHNTVNIELPLLPVPWSDDGDGRVDSFSPIAARTLTVVVADGDAKKRNDLCQLLWARRHAVVPVTSLSEVMKKVESGGADILVIDPRHLEATGEEFAALRDGATPLDALRYQTRLVVILYADDFSDWRAQKLIECAYVIELPIPASAALLHFALHEGERVVARMREDEEQIARLRMAFTQFQRDRYKVGRLIGRGAFGEVHEVEDGLTGGKLAMKRMHLNQGVMADEIAQELLAMTSLQHENIIHYFYCQKESDTRIRIYMELASGGTLQEKIRSHGGPLPLDAIVQHLRDLCRGLAYLHSKNYIHGDIKTANALIDQHGRTKIGDFGTAKRLKRKTDKMYTVVGTPQFMAPEVINADASQGIGYNQKADIWSLGCVALELASGMSPFSFIECTHGIGIFYYVSKLRDTPDLSPISDGDPLLYSFVKSCLNVDPEKRPTAEGLLLHDFLQGAGKNTRNERLFRQVEMLETLKRYSAFEHQSDEEEEESYSERSYDIHCCRKSRGCNKASPSNWESDVNGWNNPKSRREHLLQDERNFFFSSSSSSSVSSCSASSDSGG